MLTWYDITRTIALDSAVWQGDTPFSLRTLARIADGSSVNLTTLTLSAHSGTHADARYHYERDGGTINDMPLHPYLVRARGVCTSA